MNCRDADNLIQESLDRSLSAEDRARLDAHLRTCAACAKVWTEYRQIAKTAHAWLDAAGKDSRDGMAARVLAQIAAAPAPAARSAQAKATLAWTALAAVLAVAGAAAFVPTEGLPDAVRAASAFPSVTAVLTGDLTALRHFGDALQQPPAVPISSLLCTALLLPAIAANVFLARRAVRRGEAA